MINKYGWALIFVMFLIGLSWDDSELLNSSTAYEPSYSAGESRSSFSN